jgi:hypothetical protein
MQAMSPCLRVFEPPHPMWPLLYHMSRVYSHAGVNVCTSTAQELRHLPLLLPLAARHLLPWVPGKHMKIRTAATLQR